MCLHIRNVSAWVKGGPAGIWEDTCRGKCSALTHAPSASTVRYCLTQKRTSVCLAAHSRPGCGQSVYVVAHSRPVSRHRALLLDSKQNFSVSRCSLTPWMWAYQCMSLLTHAQDVGPVRYCLNKKRTSVYLAAYSRPGCGRISVSCVWSPCATA